MKDLCRKWNSICSSIHKQSPFCLGRTPTFTSLSPSNSSASPFSHRQQHRNLLEEDWPITEPHEHRFKSHQTDHPNFTILYTPPILSNPSTAPNSTSSSDIMEMDYSPPKLKELTAENLKTICSALESKVPWQNDIIPEIVSTILQCRSGMITRKNKSREKGSSPDHGAKEETWLLFQGHDSDAKEKISKELARTIFGSYNSFVSIALRSFSFTRADSGEDCRINKRSREEQSCSYLNRFVEAVSSNPHRVFFIEDIDQADYCSQMGFKRAMETGKVGSNPSGVEVGVSDAIIILSCESFWSTSRASSPTVKQKHEGSSCEEEKEITTRGSLDLNATFDDNDSIQEYDQNRSIDDGNNSVLEFVDRRIIFKIQEL